MAPSRHEQDELYSAVLAGDPTAPARAFELLLDPLIERLRFKWPRRPRRDLDEQAIDSILSYLERPQRYDPERASPLTHLTMDAHGDLLNAYEKEAAGRLGGTSLVVGVRWSLRGKDAGSVRIRSDTGATEDAVVGANSAARRHRPRFAKPSY